MFLSKGLTIKLILTKVSEAVTRLPTRRTYARSKDDAMMGSRSLFRRGVILGLTAALSLPALADLIQLPPPIVPMPIRDPCRGFGDSWSQNCRRDANGNMIDTRSGRVYDRNGSPTSRRMPVAPGAAVGSGSTVPQKPFRPAPRRRFPR